MVYFLETLKSKFPLLRSNIVVQLGNTIIVTNSKYESYNMKFTVTKPPFEPSVNSSLYGCIYCVNDIDSVWLKHDDYKIIGKPFCSNCKGKGEIELFTSIVKCDCCNNSEDV